MPHLCTLLSPCRVHVAIGKLDEVEAVLDIRVKLVHRHVSALLVPVLELACHTHVEHWQRLGTDVLRELEELKESQSVALIVVGIIAIVECVLPSVLVERTVLHRTNGVLPLVAGLKVGSLHDTSTGETQQSRLHVGKSLCHIAAQSVLAVLECVDGEEAHVLKAHRILTL